MEEKDLLKIKVILKHYMKENSITITEFSIKSGVSVGTIKTYLSGKKFISYKFISNFSNFKKIEKNDYIFLKELIEKNKKNPPLIPKKLKKNKEQNYSFKNTQEIKKVIIGTILKTFQNHFGELKDFENILDKFTQTVDDIKKNEGKNLFPEFDELSFFNKANGNLTNERKKILSLKNDYESINRAMKLMWLLNDESNKYFSELNLLLSTNTIGSNLKIKKGLLEISKNLIEMGYKLQNHIEKDGEEVIEI